MLQQTLLDLFDEEKKMLFTHERGKNVKESFGSGLLLLKDLFVTLKLSKLITINKNKLLTFKEN